MNCEKHSLSAQNIALLFSANEKIPLDDLVTLVNHTVQWGPIPSLAGPYYELDNRTIPAAIWIALNHLIDWGAAAYTGEGEDHEAIRANMAFVDLIIQAIRKKLNLLYSDTDTEVTAALIRKKKQLPHSQRRAISDGFGMEPR